MIGLPGAALAISHVKVLAVIVPCSVSETTVSTRQKITHSVQTFA